jgi:hypothetical protein
MLVIADIRIAPGIPLVNHPGAVNQSPFAKIRGAMQQ